MLSEQQLQTLRTVYGTNPRPDALLKEHLVEITGLSPRVIRVWFQNKRCKDKKKMIHAQEQARQQAIHGGPTNVSGSGCVRTYSSYCFLGQSIGYNYMVMIILQILRIYTHSPHTHTLYYSRPLHTHTDPTPHSSDSTDSGQHLPTSQHVSFYLSTFQL